MTKNKKKKSSKKTTKTTTTTTVVTTTTVDKNFDTHYLLILDRSGSMQSCWDSTINGLNEQLGTIRGLEKKYPEQRYFISLIAFDNEIQTIVDDVPVSEVEDFDGTEFPPRGMTALHDAMGIGISNLKTKIEKSNKENDDISTALVVIMTDGGENGSQEYNSKSIKKIIDELDSTDAWTFSFMGANQDAILTANSFGIGAGNSVTYSSTSIGATVAAGTFSKAMGMRGASNNMAYTTSLQENGTATMDFMDLETSTFLSDVVEGGVIGEDDSVIKTDNSTEDKA